MEEALERRELVTVTLKASEVRWHKEGKEIIIEGEFFDVKSSSIEGDEIVFTGLFDQQEKKLHQELDEAFGKQKDSRSLIVAKLIVSPFEAAPLELTIDPNKIPFKHNSFYNCRYQNHKTDIVIPPPKSFV